MSASFSAINMIGNTPMVQLPNDFCTILCKVEGKNPAGSVKDRVALYMIEDAEKQGLLTKQTKIIEATSGNTGIGLCAIAAAKGYDMTIVMPENMSIERRQLMAAYGAKVVLSPADEGMSGAIALSEKLAKEAGNAFIPGQFTNPSNPKAHYETTGPEIWRDTEGKVDIFVAGIGTGGTISGVGKYLKEQNPQIQVVGIEPAGSAVLSGGKKGSHGLQGLGAGFIPEVLDQSVLDEILPATEADAYAAARAFARTQGLLVGISSGAALWAAQELANRPENTGKTIVTLLPDSGERYLSTGLYD
ncbi:MAG: cysteine synthase A [Ruminococcaceae bacterium]|nr:cysteine synthase A [Oscillospiraceae bacterium]